MKSNFSITGKHKKCIVLNSLEKMWKIILKLYSPINGNMILQFLVYIPNYALMQHLN